MKYFSNKVLDKKIKEEGSGGDYTAGEGIDISENEISIDSDTLDDIADGAEARGYFDANGILSTSRDPFWQIGETSGLVELKSAYSYVGAKKGIIFSVNQNEDVNAHLEVVYKTMAGASNPIPVLHSRLPFYSDSFVSAGGLSPGGGGGGGGATSLEGLDDVEYTGTPIAGQALVYVIRDGVGLWTNATPTGGGTVTTVANVPPTSGGDIPKAELSAALGIGTVTQGDSQLVTGGTVYSAINSALSSVLKFVGVTTTAISDGSTTNPVIINGSSYTAVTGNVVLYGAKEYLWTGSAWEELGDEASWALKTITITGTGYLTGGGSLEANRTIDIADAIKTKIEHGESAYNRTDWDQYLGIDANGHIYVKDNRGFYSSSFVSAGGVGSGGGGGGGGATELADLEDINFVTPITGGQVLMYRDLGGGDGEWYNANIEVGGVKTVANVVPTSGGNIPLADLASAFTTGGYKLTDHEYTNGAGLSLSDGTFSLTQAVQTSLRKADTAIQTVYDLVINNSAGTTQLTYKPATSGTYSIMLTKAMVGLGDVENTKLSTWTGSGNITTVGTISSGTWQGDPIGYNYVAAHYIGGTRTASAAGQATLLGIDAISNAQSFGSSDLSRIVWDATNNAWHFLGNLYADGFVSAGGMSDSGGGGGASNLYDLLDMSSTISDKPSGTGQKIIVFNPNGTDKQNRSGAWEYANMPTGSVTSVAGVSPVNGDIPVASLQTAIGLGGYVAKSGSTMTGDLQLMNSSLRFLDDNGNIAGWLTWGGSDKQPKWYDTSGSTAAWETIWHSGNASISNSAITLGNTSLGTSTAPIGWATVVSIDGLSSETGITESGLRVYSGNGASWTGSITSMAYSAILAIGEPTRGWQIWASRIGSGANALFWRNGLADMSGWAAERVIYDSGNFIAGTNYVVPATLNSYLLLAGGTLSNSTRNFFNINSTNATGPYVQFQINGSNKGYIGYYVDSGVDCLWLGASANRLFLDTTAASLRVGTDSTNYVVYHSGNVNNLTNNVDWASYRLISNRLATRFIDAGVERVHSDHGLYIGYGARTWTSNIYFYTSTGTSGTDTVTGRTAAMVINSSSSVGIGTTNPLYRLHVYGASAASITNLVTFENTADYQWTSALGCVAPNVTAGHSVTLGLGKAAETKNLGSLQYYYAGASSDSNVIGLGLYSVDYILTCSGAGNVTIGNGITPLGCKLNVVSSAYNLMRLSRTNVGDAYIEMNNNGIQLIHVFPSSTTNALLSLRDGYGIGIGTQTPAYTLDVAGQARVLCAAGSTGTTGALQLNITSSTNVAYAINITQPNLVAGSGKFNVLLLGGVANSKNNSAGLLFNYAAADSETNSLGLGFYANDNCLRVIANGCTSIHPKTAGSFNEGIRIHPASNGYSTLIFCNSDNTGDTGTSAKSWSMHNSPNGDFYLNRNASTGVSNYIMCNVGGRWLFGTNSAPYTSTNCRVEIYNNSTGDGIYIGTTSTWATICYKASAGAMWSVGAENTYGFQFWNNSANSAVAKISTTGVFTTSGDQVVSSDINLKKNIEDLDLTVEQIAQLPAVTFDWKDGRGSTFGTVAQGVLPIFPQAVRGNEGNYSVVYGQGGWVFGVKNARAIVDIQAHETEQDKEIRKLKARVRELEKQLKMRS